jgi:signal transduction histidine kinase
VAWSLIVFIPFTYYEFAIRFLRRDSELGLVRLGYLIGGLCLVLLWSGDSLIAGYREFTWGYYGKAGPLLAGYVVAGMCFLLRPIWLLWKSTKVDASMRGVTAQRSALLVCGLYVFAAIEYVINFGVPIYPIGVVAMPAAFGVSAYAIVKHRFLDIRVVIQKGVVYSLVIAIITTVYLLTVLIAERFFQGFFGYTSLIATVIIATLVAIFVNPLRDWIQQIVDRALFQGTPAELAEQRERLVAELRKSDQMRAVATLAAGLAHEIKNPLASIKTFAEYLPERYDEPAFREKFSRIIGQEVERMNALVHRLLDFAKPRPPERRPAHLSELLNETVDLLQDALVRKRIQVCKAYADRDEALVDPGQLKQVFLNVLLNAIEAISGSGQISVGIVPVNGHIEVAITDSGRGIPKHHLSRIFDPFYTTKPEGTGLGLSVVHSIIREHGGRVTIDSREGCGSTVRIQLPAILPSESSSIPPSSTCVEVVHEVG